MHADTRVVLLLAAFMLIMSVYLGSIVCNLGVQDFFLVCMKQGLSKTNPKFSYNIGMVNTTL